VLADELKDLLDIFLEALFQHFICLIEASYLQVRQFYCPAIKQVNQPSWSRHDNVATISNLSYLFMDIRTSIDCNYFEITTHAQTMNLCSDLNC
jgi:hypothetical protein